MSNIGCSFVINIEPRFIKTNTVRGFNMESVCILVNNGLNGIKKFLDDTLKDYGKEEVTKLIRDGELHNQIFNTDYYLVYTKFKA